MLNFCKTSHFLSTFFYNVKSCRQKKKEKSGVILRNEMREEYVAG